MSVQHTIEPLRQLRAIAPSGGESVIIQWTDSPAAPSFYHGLLHALEDAQLHKAMLRVEKGGLDNWRRAIGMLKDAGWTVNES